MNLCIEQYGYHLIKVLGKGASGVTYLAEDKRTQQQVLKDTAPHIAIKCLSFRNLQSWQQIELFEKEVAVLQQLNHPQIPRYLDYFEINTKRDRAFCLVQQLAPGKSLAEWVKSGWRATEAEIKDIAIQLLSILSYLYLQQPPIVHRDIKPENIIRDSEGKIYLVDFGAVRQAYFTTMTGGNTVAGTFGYIAPEQFYGKAIPQSDLYSLGATILYLLTHTCPTEFTTDGLKIKFQDKVNISDRLYNWLEKMLEPEAEQRFSSADNALAALKGKRDFHSNQKNKSRLKNISFLILFVTCLLFLNSKKWGILNSFGILPRNICKPSVMTKYLQQGGDPNAIRSTYDSYKPIYQYCSR